MRGIYRYAEGYRGQAWVAAGARFILAGGMRR